MPEPPLEPGMEVLLQSNGTQQRTLVERVKLDIHVGRDPKWKPYLLDSKIHLDTGGFEASWPEGGPQPHFRKGDELDIPSIAGNTAKYRILTQSSLSDSAHVYLTNVYGGVFNNFMIYETSLSQLQEMLNSKQPDRHISSTEEHEAPLRRHSRRH